MIYIRLRTTDPYYNLAVEEYLLRHTEEDVFMLWQNVSTVVIGKNQNAYAEVDLAYAKEKGIRVARRLSGGGAVYHDVGNVNYTFITSEKKAAALDYAYFTKPIIAALATLGITAELSGRNDLEACGRKFSGNAQYVGSGRVLHHGTLLFNADVSVMGKVLRTDKEKLAMRAVKSHKGRVVNLAELLPKSFTVEDFISHVEKFVLDTFAPDVISAPENETVAALCARNAKDEWNLSEKQFLTEYAVVRKRRYPFGSVEIALSFAGDVIRSVRITGDFFGTKPIEDLENALVGSKRNSQISIDPAPYIAGMTGELLWELLWQQG